MVRKIECRALSPLLGNQIPFPAYATSGSAGLDLRACIEEPVVLLPGDTELIGTGLAVNMLDSGLFGMVVFP